jgi:hypothetical protein
MSPTKSKTAARPGLGAALTASLKSEKQSIDERFAAADALFEKKTEAPTAPPKSSAVGETKPKTMPSPSKAKHPPVVKPSVKTPAKKTPPAPAAIQEKVKRDTFSLPPTDYQRIFDIKKDALQAAIEVNKSEVVRAGLIALQKLSPEKRIELLQSVEKMKPGRPVE